MVHHHPHLASLLIDPPLGVGHDPFGFLRDLGRMIRAPIHRRFRTSEARLFPHQCNHDGVRNRVYLYIWSDCASSLHYITYQTYSALLVFVTQTLSTRRSLQIDQVLTATHDNAAAWAGVGAAISHLWLQKPIPARASMIGVITAALYLSTILGLHITTSSLFSLVTVNSTRSFGAPTYSLPSFSGSPNLSDM